MSHFKSILAIADPKHEDSWGLQRAGQLAQATGATLHLRAFCHHAGIDAVHALNSEVGDLARKELVREQQAWLEREADTLRTSVEKVKAKAVWGSPVHERMALEVLDLAPDLVIKDVEHVPTLKRLFFTLLDWHLLRLCSAPLMLVKRSPGKPPRKVAAAIDVSADDPAVGRLNNDVLKAAQELAELNKADLEVVHAFEGLPPPMAGAVEGPYASPEIAYETLRNKRREKFEAFVNRRAIPKDHQHFLEEGYPDLALTSFVDDKEIDILVMGSVNRTGLQRVLIGSTAERILGTLDSDVLVIKPEGYADAIRKQLQDNS